MTTALAAARYFPYRHAPDVERVIRDAPDTDRAEQALAVRRTVVHRRVLSAARPLWYSPVLVVFTIGTGAWWIGVAVTLACLVAGVVLYRIAGHLRDEVRLADAVIGIPVPDDQVETVLRGGDSMHRIHELYDAAEDDIAVYENARQHNRRLGELDQTYTRLLLEARQLWIAGDIGAWREIPERMSAVARQTGDLIDDVLH